MHCAKERGIQEIGIEARCDPHIATSEVGAERMRRTILAASAPVIAKSACDLHAELLLLGLVEWLVKDAVVDLHAAGNNCLEQRNSTGLQFAKDRPYLRGCRAW